MEVIRLARVPAFIILIFILTAPVAYPQTAETVQKELAAQAERLHGWTADKLLTSAVAAQNARKLPLGRSRARTKPGSPARTPPSSNSSPPAPAPTACAPSPRETDTAKPS